MALCYECYKKAPKDEKEENELIIYKEMDTCEGCAQWRPMVAKHADSFATFLNGLFIGWRSKK